MPGPSLLDGVDDIPWTGLRHAFGAAGDVPALLRSLAFEPAAADDALDSLCGSVCHQGSVYSATPYAVPFLARIAAAGIRTAMVVALLGWIAASDDERGDVVPGAARAAVAGQIGVLAPLLADPDAGVRAMTVWALAQAQAPGGLVPLLRERWNSETSPTVQATLLKALSVLDPYGVAGIAGGVLAGSADGGVRLMACVACVTAGMPWSGRLHEAATEWIAAGDLLPGYFWSDQEPFSDLVLALAMRGDPGAALRLVAAGLTGRASGGVREEVLWAAGQLADGYRSPAAGLVAPLAAAAGESGGERAVSVLHRLAGVPAAAGAFTAVTGQLGALADRPGPGRLADEALACLIELGDHRAAGLLARDLRYRPAALSAAVSAARGRDGQPLPFDPVLLEAVRTRLRAGDMDHNSQIWLLTLLRAWGPAAAQAVPEVLATVRRNPLGAGHTLAAIGGPVRAAVKALNRAAVTGPVAQRLSAATTLQSLTGADEPLLTTIEYGLRQRGYQLRAAAKAAQALGTTAERLVPGLTAALQALAPDGRTPDLQARTEAGLALWRHTGDTALVLPVLAEALAQSRPGLWWTAAHAADAAAEIGAPARPLVPAILPLLDSPAHCPAAVQALLRIDPGSHGGIDLAELAERLAATVGTDCGVQDRAVAALGELGPARLPPAVVTTLRRLAEQDQRIIRSGFLTEIIRSDERLRALIRQLLGQPD